MKAAYLATLCVGIAAAAMPAAAQNVKITPLGSHDGEFCPLDRALVFEDPDGTRILYDAGRTVRGANDPRLGKIDAILLSHVHGDHLGDMHQPSANAGACAKPDFSVSDTPNSNTVNIAIAKQAPVIVGGEMSFFLAAKVKGLGGDPAKLVRLVRFGASTMIGKVMVAGVPAVHSNGLAPAFLEKEQAQLLEKNGLTAYVGPPGGFVLRFSNGLTAYLSGDTGITAEQDLVVRGHYKANVVVMNIGGFPFTTGPVEATYVVNELVKPSSVIASHANEPATIDGKVVATSKTAAFIKAAKMPVHVPLSGKTMEFDASGKCVSGC
ncbi:MAG TPA: MBL fold metallo-hydrolase [Burkholderiales bacterium]|jgi:L-ascorbate metabolism protein UlaG (beta-lactamase superfamily)|nr:MBL fold metallo-hydrolase [Burkholderiales bacterium]